MAGTDGRDPFEDWQKINEELKLYNAKLQERPQIVAANKMDIPEAEEYLAEFRQKLQEIGRTDIVVYPISAASRKGVQEILYKAADLLDSMPGEPAVEDVQAVEERKVYRYADASDEDDVTIRRENDLFIVGCPSLERMVKRLQLNSHDALQRFGQVVRKKGIEQMLRERGAEDGHMVRIGDFEFEFVEHR